MTGSVWDSLSVISWEGERDQGCLRGLRVNAWKRDASLATQRQTCRSLEHGYSHSVKITDMDKHSEPHGRALPPSMKTPRYGGKANWEAFHAQFELLAQAAVWSTKEKALQLAQSSLLLLSRDNRSDYDALMGALKRQFRVCAAASLLRSDLLTVRVALGSR